MKSIVKTIGLLATMFCGSCERKFENKGSLPTDPINLTDFNTQYDDYNSTAPSLGYLIPFCFSTNRRSGGGEFDVIFEPMNVNFDKSSGELRVSNKYENWSSLRGDYEIIGTALRKIKTSSNEFGPNLIVERGISHISFTLMYSTDISGNAQINYISNLTEKEFSEPKEVAFLNSEFDDMYPTLNSDKSQLYFCSNRGGENFDFYKVNLRPDLDLKTLLSDTSKHDIIKDDFLSSASNDKCPFIFENKMVFASDRAGGFGGYDLYYSDFEEGKWSEPVNFGSKINSEADEFRPILIDEGVSSQIMMVFSSNRSGGKGGFDLYFLGIEGE